MEVGLFSVLDAFPDGSGGGRDRFGEFLDLAVAADSAGLSSLWVAEHHFHEAGLCPAPPVLLAAIGARTRRIRIGPMVSVLPFHRAVDIAEEYALLDRLVGGRLNLGIGSGYIPAELDGFGVVPELKRDRFEEVLATVLRAFRGESLRIGGANGPEVRLNVRPVQSPSPPVYVALQRREAIPAVARRGFSIALIPYATVASLEELAEEVQEFRSNRPPGSVSRVAAAVHLYVGPDPEAARAALQSYLDSRRATGSAHFLSKVAKDPRQGDAGAIESAGLAVVSTRSDAPAKLEALRATGIDEMLAIVDFGGLPLSAAIGTVREVAAMRRP